MAATNGTCNLCFVNEPSFSCSCSGKAFLVCDDCIGPHKRKNPSVPHMMVAIQLGVEDMHAYQERVSKLMEGKAALEVNLVRIDESCHELMREVDTLITFLTQYRDDWIAWLQAQRATLEADIAQAVSEVQASLNKEEVHLSGKYSEGLRNYQPGSMEVFTYRINSAPIHSCVQAFFKAELPNCPPSQAVGVQLCLPRVKDQTVCMYDFSAHSWGPAHPFNAAAKVDSKTSYLLLDSSTLMCCGNYPSGNGREGYKLHLEGGQARVETLSLMTHGRSLPGLLLFQEQVFAFGDCDHGDQPWKSVEVFAAGRWIQLQNMNCGRSKFTPCEYNGRAYLFWSFHSKLIDVLDLTTRTFRPPIYVKLPSEDTGTVSWVVGDEMTIVSGTYTAKLNLIRLVPQIITRDNNLYPASSLLVGNYMYWVDMNGRAMRNEDLLSNALLA